MESAQCFDTEEEKARVFEERHSAPFSGHTGRDNSYENQRAVLLAWLLQGHDGNG